MPRFDARCGLDRLAQHFNVPWAGGNSSRKGNQQGEGFSMFKKLGPTWHSKIVLSALLLLLKVGLSRGFGRREARQHMTGKLMWIGFVWMGNAFKHKPMDAYIVCLTV